jgi:hypothetical protein
MHGILFIPIPYCFALGVDLAQMFPSADQGRRPNLFPSRIPPRFKNSSFCRLIAGFQQMGMEPSAVALPVAAVAETGFRIQARKGRAHLAGVRWPHTFSRLISNLLDTLFRQKHNRGQREHAARALHVPQGGVDGEFPNVLAGDRNLRANDKDSRGEHLDWRTHPQLRRTSLPISTLGFPCAATNIWPSCIVAAPRQRRGRNS